MTVLRVEHGRECRTLFAWAELAAHPALNGRDALIECAHVDIEIRSADPTTPSDTTALGAK